MNFPAGRAPWLRGYLVLLFIAAALLGLYFFYYAPLRINRAEQRSFRLLADLGERIQAGIAGLAGPLTNCTANATNLEELTKWVVETGVRNLEVSEFKTNPSSAPALECTLSTAAGLPALRFEYYDARSNRVVAVSSLKRLIDPLVSQGDFDDLLVVDGSNRKVVYQQRSGNLLFTTIGLPPAGQEHSYKTNLVSGTGLDCRLFSQPIWVPYTATTETNRIWMVCGLVQAKQFRQRALAVPYAWCLPIVLLLLLLPMAWPFFNAYFLADSLRLRPRHLYAVYLAALGGSALVLLGVLTWLAYNTLEDRLDEQLRRIAERMVSNFQDELHQDVRQLRHFDQLFSKSYRTSLTNLLTEGPPEITDRVVFPYFKMAVWIDSKGMQLAKWTPEKRTTPLVSIRQREYFRQVRAHEEWPTFSGRVFIEPIYSSTTGENLAEIAMRGSNTEVVTLTTRFLTLFHPVLPADCGFCVLDPSGRVLFHSDENRNLRENFLTECEEQPALLAAIRGRNSARFDAMYCGRAHSVFVTPIPDLPWSLAVFRDESKVQGIQLAALTGAVVLHGCGLLILLLGLSVLYVSHCDHGLLWPARGRETHYLALAAVNTFLSALLLWLAPSGRMTLWWWILVPVLLPAAGLSLGWLILSLPVPRWTTAAAVLKGVCGFHVGPINAGNAYALGLASLILLSGIVPAALAFQFAFSHEMRLLIKRAQMHLANDMDARRRAIREQYRVMKVPEGFVEGRIRNQRWDCYYEPFFETSMAREERLAVVVGREDFSAWLSRFRPDFGDAGRESAAYRADGADDLAWLWETAANPFRLTLLKKQNDGSNKAGRWNLAVRSVVPPLWSKGDWRLWLAVGVGVLVPLFLARRITCDNLLPLQESEARAAPVFDPEKPDCLSGCRLVLGAYAPGQMKLPPDWIEVDWRKGSQKPAPVSAHAGSQPEPLPHQIWLRGFEEGAHDPKVSQKKFQALERWLSDRARDVLIFSTVHPLNFNLDPPSPTRGKGEFTAESAPAARAKWSQVLKPFKTLYTSQTSRLRVGEPDTYRCFWATCAPREKLMLFDLARTGIVNPKAPGLSLMIARKAVREGTVPPRLEERFGQWVLQNFKPEEAPTESSESTGATWRAFRGPLLLALLIGGLVVFTTQKSLWEGTVGLLSAFATGLTTVIAALKALWQFKEKQAPEPQ